MGLLGQDVEGILVFLEDDDAWGVRKRIDGAS